MNRLLKGYAAAAAVLAAILGAAPPCAAQLPRSRPVLETMRPHAMAVRLQLLPYLLQSRMSEAMRPARDSGNMKKGPSAVPVDPNQFPESSVPVLNPEADAAS